MQTGVPCVERWGIFYGRATDGTAAATETPFGHMDAREHGFHFLPCFALATHSLDVEHPHHWHRGGHPGKCLLYLAHDRQDKLDWDTDSHHLAARSPLPKSHHLDTDPGRHLLLLPGASLETTSHPGEPACSQ